MLAIEDVKRKIDTKDSSSSAETPLEHARVFETIDRYYDAINMQDYQTAYYYLSSSAQIAYGSPEDYAYAMAQSMAQSGSYVYHVARHEGIQVSGDTANAIVVVEYNQSGQIRSYRIAYQLVKENCMWRINQATQPEEVK